MGTSAWQERFSQDGATARATSSVQAIVPLPDSGIDFASLSVTAGFVVNRLAAGTDLASLALSSGDGIWSISLSPPVASVWSRYRNFSVGDDQGNITWVDRAFFIGTAGTLFHHGMV